MEEKGSPSHDLQAKLELRHQLEEATSSQLAESPSNAVESPQPVSNDEAVVTCSLNSWDDPKKTAVVSPRQRSPEAVQREKDLKETFRQAAQRSSWNPGYQSDESWNGRHHLTYCNDEMSQNCRCYFDRCWVVF